MCTMMASTFHPMQAGRSKIFAGSDAIPTGSDTNPTSSNTKPVCSKRAPGDGLPCTAHPTALTYSLLVTVLALAAACSAPEPLYPEKGIFGPSEFDATTFFEYYSSHIQLLSAVSGQAAVQVSEPGNTERLTVRFQSDRARSLLLLRNNLGIEGGRIYSGPDSVIIYNRLEQEAHKMSHDDAAWFYLNGVTALNLIQILYPVTGPEHISRILENDRFFLVEERNGDRHFIDRERMVIIQTERQVHQPDAYNTFLFENHAEIEGFHLPRRIRILSSDRKSSIFLVIRALDVNPSELNFDPGIPDDIELIRL